MERFRAEMVCTRVRLPAAAARARAGLFALGAVVDERIDADGAFTIEVRCPRQRFEDWRRREGLGGDILAAADG